MIQLTTESATCVVEVTGDLDVVERDAFSDVLLRARTLEFELLVVDLCRSDFLDATGAGFLVDLSRSARARGARVVLRGADDRALFVLDVVGGLDGLVVDEEHFCPEPAGDGDSALDGAGLTGPALGTAPSPEAGGDLTALGVPIRLPADVLPTPR